LYILKFESKKSIFLILTIIVFSSFFLKLYTIDFSISEIQDNWLYVLRAISINNGIYAESPIKPSGFPLILSFLFNTFEPSEFVDHVNIVRIFNIIISSATIYPLYLLARNFFDKKFSLFLPLLFAFQPQLNFNVGLGMAEPIFLFFLILSYHFILKKDSKYGMYFSFLFVGILFWVRFTGLLFFIPIIICQLMLHRDIKKFLLCSIILFLIISPILVLRYEQFGNPLHFEGIGGSDLERSNFLPEEFDQKWLTLVITNISNAFGTMSLPYLIFLFPLGILSYRLLSAHNKNFFIYNLIFFSIAFFPLLLQYYVFTSSRTLFHLYPFIMIFAIFSISAFYENKLKFFTIQRKKIIIVLMVTFVVCSSVLITVGIGDYGYGKPNTEKIHELLEYNKFLLSNIDGNVFWSKGESVRWMNIAMIEGSGENFKNYKIDTTIGYKAYSISSLKDYYPTKLNIIDLPNLNNPSKADTYSLDLFFIEAEKSEIEYLSIGEKNDHKIFNEIYEDEHKFAFLEKIFDSKNNNFKNYNVKLFKIDYEKLHELRLMN